ncbi:hypothetical protein HPB48_014043 [Haemaphysalis longicornis]|uniref:Uncharacterized protein n=1 Tax=Haemaphysalis longicornis TaxID=44386 RepID=A0A9J6GTU8_HAELO|nr:hypothetical protein HPB48_014043 [Haemaphysalis longicornis]
MLQLTETALGRHEAAAKSGNIAGFSTKGDDDTTFLEHALLLILDEPTTGLDPEVRRSVWDALQAVDKSQTSTLLSTHDMEEADAMADQIIIMAHGRVVCSGSTAFLKKACSEYTLYPHGDFSPFF